MPRCGFFRVAGWFLLCLGGVCAGADSPSSVLSQPAEPLPAFRADRILLQRKAQVSPAALARLHAVHRARVWRSFEGMGRLQVVRVPPGETVRGLITKYEQSGLVEFAEPDYAVHAAATLPNDPKFLDGTLWGLHNTGQAGGLADADIDAPEGWDLLTSASNIVVAVLDTGVRYTHEDLAANMWVNPDGSGHGWNALAGSPDPKDDNGHGTLVSGTLGGVGNNGKGVVGVAWQVQIMACKCLDNAGNGNDSELIECLDFARTNGARIINASLDSSSYSQALSNAILSLRTAGILFVASAGNDAANIDLNPRYPACYDIDNIVTVAYTTRTDALGAFSNYGATNVDLAAPGAALYSTFFTADNAYLGANALQGASFAAPYVAGACALLLARYPSETPQQILRRLLAGVDPVPALSGKCVTGGRLNLREALSHTIRLSARPTVLGGPFPLRISAGPSRTCVIERTTNLEVWVPVFTNTTAESSVFEFRDEPLPAVGLFYRAVAAP
jgi:subtilisin family serine protease